MPKLNYANGITSVILRVKIQDSASVSGGGKTGLLFSSTGLIISTLADTEAAPTAYTAAGNTIETITTLGTFATPTANKCRFKEVDATNHPGLYEIQIANARWAVSNARSVIVSVSGASAIVQVDAEIQLEPVTANLTAAGSQSIWDVLTSALVTANSIGKRLADDVDATISSRLDSASYTLPLDDAETAAAVQQGMDDQGYTEVRAGYLDTLNGLVIPDPWLIDLVAGAYSGNQAGALLRAAKLLLSSGGAHINVPYDPSRHLITMKRDYGLVEVGGAVVPVITSRRVTTLTGATITLIVKAPYEDTDRFTKDLTSESVFDGDDLLTSIVITPMEAKPFAPRVYSWELIATYSGGTVLLDEGKIDIN